MEDSEINIVTGAFGFSGKYIARRLLGAGKKIRTLTNSKNCPIELVDKIEIYPLNFDNTNKLVESFKGCSVLYNTYWIRFNYKNFNHSIAVENTLKLFNAAKKAGVKRIIHTSITNPSEKSSLSYFSGKAKLENALIESGVSYSILRPAVLFGKEDVLINNIAWMLRIFPVFGVFSDGAYKLQPIYVDDFALIAVEQGEKSENNTINTIGVETFTYKELVTNIGEIIGKKRPILSIPDNIGYLLGQIIGKFVNDVVITREEIQGLKSNLLYVDTEPVGKTKLTEWAKENSSTIGIQYVNELKRRKKQ